MVFFIAFMLRSNKGGGQDMAKKAKSNAQRQAEYRARRYNAGPNGDPEYRVNTWISSEAHYALNRLAAYYGATKREILEDLLIKADDQVCDILSLEGYERYLCLELRAT